MEPEDGVEPPSDAEIEAAARQANAHDFIVEFPEGYETNCGEKGAQMSGGGMQGSGRPLLALASAVAGCSWCS